MVVQIDERLIMTEKSKDNIKIYIEYFDGTSVSIQDCDEHKMWDLLNKIREHNQYIIEQLNITKETDNYDVKP